MYVRCGDAEIVYMIYISDILLRDIQHRISDPFVSGHGVVFERRVLLLELLGRSGEKVVSECVAQETGSYWPETVETARYVIETFLIPAVVGREFGSIEAFWECLNGGVRGHQMAKAAIEMGAWEFTSESLKSALGAEAELEGLKTGIVIGIQSDLEGLRQKVETAVLEGVSRVKLKVRPGWDIEAVRTAAESVGDTILAVDCNGGYSRRDLPLFKEMEALGVGFVEQPVASDDWVGMKAIQDGLGIPVCLDESVGSFSDAEAAILFGCGRMINIKPGRVGGFLESLKIYEFCLDHDIEMFVGGMHESPVGRGQARTFAGLSGFSLAHDLI